MPELEYSDKNFDLTSILEIADGSDEFLVELIDTFLKQTPELMYAIDRAIKDGDHQTGAQAAHKLKPNLGFFGMLESQTMMQEIEHMFKNNQPLAEILPKFGQVVARVRPTLVKFEVIMKEKAANL